jgi:hypothetical protein
MSNMIDYFRYKGVRYGCGTVVKFKNKNKHDVEYGKYFGMSCLFKKMISPDKPYVGSIENTIVQSEDIEEIVVPVLYNSIEKIKKCNDTDSNDMFYAWIFYIAVMLFISIIKCQLIGWIFATIVFYNYRRGKLYEKKNGDK